MGMPRRLRIQYPDAIYHLMARGNGRQDIVRDDHDRQRLLAGLARAVQRCSWRVYAFVILSNHFHVGRGVRRVGCGGVLSAVPDRRAGRAAAVAMTYWGYPARTACRT